MTPMDEARLKAVCRKYRGLVVGVDDESLPSAEALAEVFAWQALEIDVLEAYGDWLERTKAKFQARGVAWTTDNLARYSRLWEIE